MPCEPPPPGARILVALMLVVISVGALLGAYRVDAYRVCCTDG